MIGVSKVREENMLGRFIIGMIMIVFDLIANFVYGLVAVTIHLLGWEMIIAVIVGLVVSHYVFHII